MLWILDAISGIVRAMNDEFKKVQKELGDRLRNVRERARLTQAQVAAAAGVDHNYYARIERGTANPSLEKLHRVMKVLKIRSLVIH